MELEKETPNDYLSDSEGFSLQDGKCSFAIYQELGGSVQ